VSSRALLSLRCPHGVIFSADSDEGMRVLSYWPNAATWYSKVRWWTPRNERWFVKRWRGFEDADAETKAKQWKKNAKTLSYWGPILKAKQHTSTWLKKLVTELPTPLSCKPATKVETTLLHLSGR